MVPVIYHHSTVTKLVNIEINYLDYKMKVKMEISRTPTLIT